MLCEGIPINGHDERVKTTISFHFNSWRIIAMKGKIAGKI